MAKLFDFECQTCLGIYEAWDTDSGCKYCGSTNTKKVYIKAPGTYSPKSKIADNMIDRATQGFGLTDFNNNPSTMHDKHIAAKTYAFDPGKDMDGQIAEKIAAMRPGGVPYNHPKMGPVTNIPVMDADSGAEFKRIMDYNRSNKTRRSRTEIVASINKDGAVRLGQG